MISLQLKLYIFIVLAANSGGLPSTDQSAVRSQITINKSFRNSKPSALKPELPPSFSNFVHHGTNFFFNPQLLLGSFVPPQVETFITKIKENITETPVSENTTGPETTGPNEITPTPYPPIIIDESIVVRPPFPTLEKIEIPPAPILPPLELSKITTIIEEIFPRINDKARVISKVIPIHLIEPELRILERDIINLVPKQLTMKFPVALEFPTFITPDIPEFSDEGEIVVLVPPIPEIPTLINPIGPIFYERIIDPPFPTVCARDIILERVLPNIVISQKTFTKNVEFITIPSAQKANHKASVFSKIINE